MEVPLSFNKCLDAIYDELKSLYDNHIFMTFVIDLTNSKIPIKVKWIFNIKRDSNNNKIKIKERLEAKSYSQIIGLDYELTFLLTLSIDNIKLIISLAATFHWVIY